MRAQVPGPHSASPLRRRGVVALWLIVVVIAVALRLPAGSATAAATWNWKDRVGDIGPRYGHVAVRMADGRVLVAGGLDDTRRGR
jgi:hypothetical protein